MRTHAVFYFVLLAVGFVASKPANNDQLDKATVNDVAANAVVTPEKKADVVADNSTDKKEGATVHITGITTGIENGGSAPGVDNNGTQFRPQKTGSMFARLIDDIFQIPINVLQNVARLITSPFTQHNKAPASPEAVAPPS